MEHGLFLNTKKLVFDEVVNQLPQDEEGRLLDYKTRHLIHDALIAVS